VGNWLYGVAYRTALKARTTLARRRTRERQVAVMPEPEEAPREDLWHDLQPLLDQELSRLPDKYRVPVVLCHLEGKSQREAAGQLGWPEGTLSVRLMRARALLAKRLARRGVVVSAGSLALVFAEGSAPACLPAPLVASTVKAATLVAAGQAVTTAAVSAEVTALTKGVLHAMSLTKLKSALVLILVVTLACVGAGIAAYSSPARPTPRAELNQKEPDRPAVAAPGGLKNDNAKIQGTWVAEFTEKDGGKGQGGVWVIIADKIVLTRPGVGVDGGAAYTLDPTRKPKAIDLTFDRGPAEGKTLPGIYELDGDELKICYVSPDPEEGRGKGRPTGFAAKAGSGHLLWVFKRQPDQGCIYK